MFKVQIFSVWFTVDNIAIAIINSNIPNFMYKIGFNFTRFLPFHFLYYFLGVLKNVSKQQVKFAITHSMLH